MSLVSFGYLTQPYRINAIIITLTSESARIYFVLYDDGRRLGTHCHYARDDGHENSYLLLYCYLLLHCLLIRFTKVCVSICACLCLSSFTSFCVCLCLSVSVHQYFRFISICSGIQKAETNEAWVTIWWVQGTPKNLPYSSHISVVVRKAWNL